MNKDSDPLDLSAALKTPNFKDLIDPKCIYSVETLNNKISQQLQKDFKLIYVEGEISNLVKAASGHFYFTLKDAKAQIKCVLFQNSYRLIKLKNLSNGQKILVKATLSVYVPRGDYQLIVENIYPTGLGALQLAYEQLKQKLATQGLFDNTHKKAIPRLPKTIWVVTSPDGAAVRDIIATLKLRFAAIPINVIPTTVQGENAYLNIIKALHFADTHSNPLTDVIILARGGGSIEDLWAFNNEQLAQTIFKTKTPVVTGIGHETDFTIADFVADLRAATPTAAAQAASPNCQEYLFAINKLTTELVKIFRNSLLHYTQKIQFLSHRLLQQHPETKITNQIQVLDEKHHQLVNLVTQNIYQWTHQIKILNYQLQQNNPLNFININLNTLSYKEKILNNLIQNSINNAKSTLHSSIKKLNSNNPLEILSRGYSIIEDSKGNLITNKNQVAVGDKIKAILHYGKIECQVI